LKKFFIILLFLQSCFLMKSLAQAALEEKEQEKKIEAKELKAEISFNQGMKYFLIEDYSKAVSEFKLNIATYGVSEAAYFMLSKAEKQQNNFESALINAKEAVKLNETNYFYQELKYSLEDKLKRYEDAVKTLKILIKLKPQIRSNHLALTKTYLYLEEPSAAVKSLKDLEDDFGIDDSSTSLKQEILLRQNKLKAALKEGEKMNKIDPDYAAKQAGLLIEAKKYKEAQDYIEKSIEGIPLKPELYTMLSDLYANNNNLSGLKKLFAQVASVDGLPVSAKMAVLGNFFAIAKHIPDAEVDINNMVQKLLLTYPSESKLYVYQGDMLIKSSKIIDAKTAYLKAVKLDPGLFEAWLAVVELDLKMGSFDEMKVHTEMALEYFPNQAYFWYHSGFALMQKKEKEDALIAFEEAAKLSSKNKELLLNINANMANIYSDLGQNTKAQTLYEGNLKQSPFHEQTQYDFTVFLLKIKDYSKAKIVSTALSEKYPNTALNHDLRALSLLGLGNASEALILIEKTIATLPHPKLWETLGDILTSLNKTQEAKAAYQTSKEKGWSSESLSKKINQ
jgi:tetratricopeptide (TPR) repeat protein